MGTSRRLALLGAAALAGCTVGPDFQRPSPWSPASWFRGTPAEPARAPASLPVAEPVDVDWWTVFNDPVLTGLMRRVAASNLDVRVASIRLAEARAQRGVTAADLFPQVNGNASYTRERLSERGVIGVIGGQGAGGGAGGARAATAARRPAAAPRHRQQRPRRPLRRTAHRRGRSRPAAAVRPVPDRVRRLVGARPLGPRAPPGRGRRRAGGRVHRVAPPDPGHQPRRAGARLPAAPRHPGIAADRPPQPAERGAERPPVRRARPRRLSSDLDVANARAQVEATAATIPQLQQQEQQGVNAISLLLGAPPGSLAAELLPEAPLPPVPPRVPVGVPSELVRRRPDIRQAEAQLHAATADIGAAEADFFPRITLSGSFALQAVQFKDLGNWGSRTAGLGPSISIPIFEGGRLRRTLELRRAQQQEAAVSYQRTVLAAFHDVDNALIAYRFEQQRRDRLAAQVQQARRALGLSQQRYRDGVSDFLEVLTAQRTALQAEQALADSTTAVATNLVALYKALGGGWEASPLPEARTAAR